MSYDKHEKIHILSSCLIEKNPTVFEPLLFSTNSVRRIKKLVTDKKTYVKRMFRSKYYDLLQHKMAYEYKMSALKEP